MTRHRVEHVSEFSYGAAVHGNLMLLRLHPSEDFGQRVLSFRLKVRPSADWVACEDAFGNRCHLLSIHRRHRHATVRASSEVETAAAPPLPERINAESAWNALSDPGVSLRCWEFLAHGGLARPGPGA